MIEDKERYSDPIDAADYFRDSVINDSVKEAQRRAAAIPEGNPGECDGCGEWSGRLVDGYCSPCRDKYARYIHGA